MLFPLLRPREVWSMPFAEIVMMFRHRFRLRPGQPAASNPRAAVTPPAEYFSGGVRHVPVRSLDQLRQVLGGGRA